MPGLKFKCLNAVCSLSCCVGGTFAINNSHVEKVPRADWRCAYVAGFNPHSQAVLWIDAFVVALRRANASLIGRTHGTYSCFEINPQYWVRPGQVG